MNYTFNDPPITFRSYAEHGECEIGPCSVREHYRYEGKYQILIYELILVRRRAYYILTMMVPMSVLWGLNLMVF